MGILLKNTVLGRTTYRVSRRKKTEEDYRSQTSILENNLKFVQPSCTRIYTLNIPKKIYVLEISIMPELEICIILKAS